MKEFLSELRESRWSARRYGELLKSRPYVLFMDISVSFGNISDGTTNYYFCVSDGCIVSFSILNTGFMVNPTIPEVAPKDPHGFLKLISQTRRYYQCLVMY